MVLAQGNGKQKELGKALGLPSFRRRRRGNLMGLSQRLAFAWPLQHAERDIKS